MFSLFMFIAGFAIGGYLGWKYDEKIIAEYTVFKLMLKKKIEKWLK